MLTIPMNSFLSTSYTGADSTSFAFAGYFRTLDKQHTHLQKVEHLLHTVRRVDEEHLPRLVLDDVFQLHAVKKVVVA